MVVPPGGHAFFGVFTELLHVGFLIIVFVIAAGLLILLVRFLLVATKAAQLYVEKNSSAPTRPGAPPEA